MDIKDLDMNLLVVFDALFETGSVTIASKKLALSQPTISYGLAKLRESFNDPLFIRIDNKMQPTPRAAIMAPQVKRPIIAKPPATATSIHQYYLVLRQAA